MFARRPSHTPSLNELAFPDADVKSRGAGQQNEENDENDGEEEEEDEEEDEREPEQLQRAKARAFSRRIASVTSSGVVEASPAINHWSSDDSGGIAGVDLDRDGDDNEGGTSEEQPHLSSNVAELQHQVRALLEAQIRVDDAWRQQNASVQQQLERAEARVACLEAERNRLNHAESRAAADAPQDDDSRKRGVVRNESTPRERELLRLLIRVVGKDQVRHLLAPPAHSTAQSSPEQLRRRLTTRAASSRHSRRAPLSRAAPNALVIGGQYSKKSSAQNLCRARKHEMSEAL